MKIAIVTLEPYPNQQVGPDVYRIDLGTYDVIGPALHDPARIMGFQTEAEVQRVMMFADDLWAENPQMAVGMYPVFVAKRGGLFNLTLAVASVTVETIS